MLLSFFKGFLITLLLIAIIGAFIPAISTIVFAVVMGQIPSVPWLIASIVYLAIIGGLHYAYIQHSSKG